MYNRYVPQADGSFLKTRFPEPEQMETQSGYAAPPPLPGHDLGESCREGPTANAVGIGSFFKNLLPQGLDTEDLIVVLLLLLIGQDKGKNGNKALLTLGAYLFL